jgi:hypothetical protein
VYAVFVMLFLQQLRRQRAPLLQSLHQLVALEHVDVGLDLRRQDLRQQREVRLRLEQSPWCVRYSAPPTLAKLSSIASLSKTVVLFFEPRLRPCPAAGGMVPFFAAISR